MALSLVLLLLIKRSAEESVNERDEEKMKLQRPFERAASGEMLATVS